MSNPTHWTVSSPSRKNKRKASRSPESFNSEPETHKKYRPDVNNNEKSVCKEKSSSRRKSVVETKSSRTFREETEKAVVTPSGRGSAKKKLFNSTRQHNSRLKEVVISADETGQILTEESAVALRPRRYMYYNKE